MGVSRWHDRLFLTPWTVARQAPPSMGFSRQEYWSGVPSASPGIFLTQGSNLGLVHCRRILCHLSHLYPSKSFKWWPVQLVINCDVDEASGNRGTSADPSLVLSGGCTLHPMSRLETSQAPPPKSPQKSRRVSPALRPSSGTRHAVPSARTPRISMPCFAVV